MREKVMVTITSKGQITLPIELRRFWGLKPGDQIAFDPPNAATTVIAPSRKRSIFDRLDELKLPKLPKVLTLQEIDDAIGDEMVEQDLRSRGLL